MTYRTYDILYIIVKYHLMARLCWHYHLRMMTVRLIAIATLMSTFITESMCLVRFSKVIQLYYVVDKKSIV